MASRPNECPFRERWQAVQAIALSFMTELICASNASLAGEAFPHCTNGLATMTPMYKPIGARGTKLVLFEKAIASQPIELSGGADPSSAASRVVLD
jgi:hypothetical protein